MNKNYIIRLLYSDSGKTQVGGQRMTSYQEFHGGREWGREMEKG